MTDVYSNLPGTIVSIKDGGLAVNAPAPSPKVTIIAVTTSDALEVGDPVLTTRLSEALALSYHPNGDPSEMTFAVAEAYKGGARSVELMRICPVDSSGNPTATGSLDPVGLGDIPLATRYSLLQDAYALLLDHPVDIVVPYNVYLDLPSPSGTPSGSYDDFGFQLANFCWEVSHGNDMCIGVIANQNELQVAGATGSGLLFGTPTLTQMSSYVTALTHFTRAPHFDGTGYAGVDSKGRPTAYAFYLNKNDHSLPGTIVDAEVDANGWPIDQGAYISVTAGMLKHSNMAATIKYPEQGYYNGNGAAYYAGMVSQLRSEVSPTNKDLAGLALARKFSLSQVNSLVGSRYVVPRISGGNRLVVADAMTAAWNSSLYYRSDYTRLTTVRIVHEVGDIIRATIDPFIGEPNNPVVAASIQSKLDKMISDLVERGALLSGTAVYSQTPDQRALNEATVEVSLSVPGEVRRVNVSIGLTKAGV
jgi:hypothetical protein